MTRLDGRVERGNRTRRTVLRRAVDIASVEGLEALSVGRLAGDLELSKSGVFALLGPNRLRLLGRDPRVWSGTGVRRPGSEPQMLL